VSFERPCRGLGRIAVLTWLGMWAGTCATAPLAAASAASDPVTAAQPADATISGLVEDPSGGAIGGASIRVTCGTVVRDLVSDGTGAFRVRNLPAMPCVVDVRTDLFAPRRLDIDMSNPRTAFLRVVLTLAGIAGEVTVTPARGEQERTFDIPEPVSVATREEIESRPHHILPQVLHGEPGVLVQQTTTAQGSPFIRGFSAQRIVYLLDGIRYNTSTFRAGATQYFGWISPSVVQRLEVVRGPASVQYGSDALGGTVHVISQRPRVLPDRRELAGHVGALFGQRTGAAARMSR
jgi:outer membrane receptor protein involved in Fe transport